ncbi:MAG: hypothetical protein ACLFUR_05300 [Candidatus Hadarchaeia archaeon]
MSEKIEPVRENAMPDKVGRSDETLESNKGSGPVLSRRIPINSKKRNLQVVIWGGENGPSIALEEGKNTENGWQNKRIYLPVSKSFEIAERIKEAGLTVRDSNE